MRIRDKKTRSSIYSYVIRSIAIVDIRDRDFFKLEYTTIWHTQ